MIYLLPCLVFPLLAHMYITYSHMCITYPYMYGWPLNNTEVRGADFSHSQKSTYNYSWPSTYVYSQLRSSPLNNAGLNCAGQLNWAQLKNLRISGTAQLKPGLFQGQLYITYSLAPITALLIDVELIINYVMIGDNV